MADGVRWAIPSNRGTQPGAPRSQIVTGGETLLTPVVVAEAVARVRVRSVSDATVEAPPAPVPLRPAQRTRPANPGAQTRSAASRVVSGLTPTEAANVVTADAVGRVRVRTAADAQVVIQAAASAQVRVRSVAATLVEVQAAAQGRVRVRSTAPEGDSVPVPYRALRSRANQPRPARLASRLPTHSFPEPGVVSASAVGRVRVRTSTAASVEVQAAARGQARLRSAATGESVPVPYRALANRRTNQPRRARLGSRFAIRPPVAAQELTANGRLRVRSTATAFATTTASASGRVRVRATADGSALGVESGVRRVRANQPQRARLRSRVFQAPALQTVTSSAAGRVRVRSTATGQGIAVSSAQGRVRVRSAVVGVSIRVAAAAGRVRVRATATSVRMAVASAAGRVRVRAQAAGIGVAQGTAQGRVRVRSTAAGSKTTFGSVQARLRVRSTAVGDFFGQNFQLAEAHGRLKVWSRHAPITFDDNPRWPQSTDPDRWPQSTDPDRWPQSASSGRWPA